MANAACVVQIGDGNRTTIDQVGSQNSSASVHIRGDGNGTGTVKAPASIALNRAFAGRNHDADKDGIAAYQDAHDGDDQRGTVAAGRLSMPKNLPSGLVQQRGPSNSAEISIVGNNNDFYISQEIGGNLAEQVIRGSRNTVVALQGGGGDVSQTQIGTGNLSYVNQARGNDQATTFQFAASSRILLEQDGDGNSADLSQVGFGHTIALRQTGGVTASISQYGVGRTIAIQQDAGTVGASPLVVTQY